MKPRNWWNFAIAILSFVASALGFAQLYQSGDFSKDCDGLLWLAMGLVWLYQAYRKPKAVAAK